MTSSLISHFTYVNQTFYAGHNLYESPKFHNLNNPAVFVDFSNFRFGS